MQMHISCRLPRRLDSWRGFGRHLPNVYRHPRGDHKPPPAGTSTSLPSMAETFYPRSDVGSSSTARMSSLRPPPDNFDNISTPRWICVCPEGSDRICESLARLVDLHLRGCFSFWRSYAPFSIRRSELALSENSLGLSPWYRTAPFCQQRGSVSEDH
jgi:hypothetical protein